MGFISKPKPATVQTRLLRMDKSSIDALDDEYYFCLDDFCTEFDCSPNELRALGRFRVVATTVRPDDDRYIRLALYGDGWFGYARTLAAATLGKLLANRAGLKFDNWCYIYVWIETEGGS